MGNHHVFFRLIIFLQFADLVLMSTYNFSNCNHKAIRDTFGNVLVVSLIQEPEKRIDPHFAHLDFHECGEEEGELLECIQNISRCCRGSRNEDLWPAIRAILNAGCVDYFPSKNVECQESRSKIHQMKKQKGVQGAQPCEQHRLQELLAVLRSYMNL